MRVEKLKRGKVRVFVTADTGNITLALVGKDSEGEILQVHEVLTPTDVRAVVANLERALDVSAKYRGTRTQSDES